jgi:hypothetical protein
VLYRRRSIRIPTFQAETLRRVALEEGWELADFIRALICLGADASFLSLNNPETRDKFETKGYLGKAVRALDATLGKSTARGYSQRESRDTSVLSIRIPRSLDTNVRTYAVNSSVNETYAFFLVSGLVLHMTGQKALLETLNSLSNADQAIKRMLSGRDTAT